MPPYSQSSEQKAKLIMKSYIEPRLKREPRDEEAHRLWNKYTQTYNRKGKHAEFVEWFRSTYPKEYMDLFA